MCTHVCVRVCMCDVMCPHVVSKTALQYYTKHLNVSLSFQSAFHIQIFPATLYILLQSRQVSDVLPHSTCHYAYYYWHISLYQRLS